MNATPLRILNCLLAFILLILLVFSTSLNADTAAAEHSAETASIPALPHTTSLTTVRTTNAPSDIPEPLVLEAFDEWTVGGGYLYWATNCHSNAPNDLPSQPYDPNNHYALHRWPINGGTPETIVIASHTNCNTFRFLTADDDGVFFWNNSQNRLENYPIGRAPGQNPLVVRNNINNVSINLQLDNNNIYYTNNDRIRRVPKNGSENKLIHDTGYFVRSIAVDTGRNDIYWVAGNGLWYGRKNCASPPCAKRQLDSALGSHISLGTSDIRPRTVYMVEQEYYYFPPIIRSYDCQIVPCQVQKLYEGGTSVLEVGLPAWTQTGFALLKDWLIWPERTTTNGLLRQKELSASVTTRHSGSTDMSMKVIIESGQVYFADQASGNEQIMRIPILTESAPRDFGNLSLVNNPELSAEWKPIVRVESEWDDKPNNIFLCTGTLIDPGIVITAGRCVYDRGLGKPADRVRVIPTYVDGVAPFGDAYQVNTWTFNEFINDGNRSHDIGWIKLERPVGALTGWHAIAHQDDLFLWLATFNNPGYPRTNFDSQLLYNRNGQFNEIDPEELMHTAEIANMKGSPALNLDDLTVYGIESRIINSGTTTLYARLTQTKVEHIEDIITNNTPTAVDLVPLKFRMPINGGLVAGTWPTSESFTLHNYSTASTPADHTVTINLYLSTDGTIDTTDTFLATGTFQIPGTLNGRQTISIPDINWSGTPAIPLDTPPGNYWLGLILDEDDAIPANNATHGWDATAVQILPPQMSVTPNTLTAVANIGDPPIEETVTVDILGNGTNNPDFNWTSTSNASWLSVDPANGGDGEEVTLIIDSEGLGSGTYQGQINFATDLQDGSGVPVATAAVNVTLHVDLGEAMWQPEPVEMNFAAVAGGPNPPSQGLIVKATIDYPFNWIVEDGSSVSDDASWLPINSGAGTAPGVFDVAPDISGLSPGEYSTQLAIHSPDLVNYALTTVNLTVYEEAPPQPILQLSPTTLFYEATVGQTAPDQQTFRITNSGTGQLTWFASSDVPWLNLDQNSGSGDAEIVVGVSADGLPPGTHVGQITVTDGTGREHLVRAVLQLRQAPTMGIDGRYLVFSGLSGQPNPPPQNFTVRNLGTGSFNWFISETSSWLETTPSQGTTPGSVDVTADTTNLDPGAYESKISVTSPTALDSPQEIDVRLFLRPGPVLATTPQVLDFSVVAGTSDGQQKSITIANASRGNLEWTAESNVSWLSLGQTAGVTGAFGSTSVNVNVDATNLTPHDDAYVGQITVRSGNGQGSPQTITVFLHVFSPARYCNIPNGGQGYVINSRNARIRFTDVQRTLTADGGCDFSAILRASLPQNARLESQVVGHVDSNNIFIPTTSSPLELKIAVFTLQLTNDFSISDDFGLRVVGGQWKLPKQYGGRSKNFDGAIQINASGISLEGAGTFDLPNIDYGAMQIYQLQGQISVAADGSYLVEVTGNMKIGIVGDGTSIEGVELRLDQRGFRSGRIGTFTIKDIAGVDIEVVSATFDGDKIRADKAILTIPQAWGGTEGAIYGLTIDFDGNLRVTGGRFKLPSISAGGNSFKLSSLEGEFHSVSGGYEIQARGEFGMRGIGGGGGCTLIVDVTIFSDAGTSVLAIDSVDGPQPAVYTSTNNPDDTAAIEGIALRELTLGIWDCQPGLPIGATGFELTGVQGTVKLHSGLEEVSLKIQVQSIAKLGGTSIPFLSMEPQATLRPAPFFLGYDGPTYMTNIKVSDTTGKFEKRRFSAEMRFDFIVLHGGLGIEAGLNNGGSFYLEGNGWADVSVKKGSVFRECLVGLCANIPPVSLTLAKVNVEVSLTHISGNITVSGYGASFKYSFRTGDFDVSLESRSRAITSEEIRQAQAFQLRHVGPMPPSYEQITFVDNERVLLTLPVDASIPQADGRDLAAAQLTTAVQSDALFILVQPAEGQLAFVLIDPNGQEYTPANLPENIQFEQAVVDGTQQMVYSVAEAQPGAWQTRVEGDINGTDFVVFETLNVAPSMVEDLTLTPTSNLNEVEVQWRHLAQEETPRITLYANVGEITQTVTYTDAQGVLITGITDKFSGEPVAEFTNPPTDGRLQTALVDLSQLPGGSYAFWIEAEGIETGGVRCYIRQSASSCGEPVGEVARFIVDHSSTFPSAWDPNLMVDVVITDGLLHTSWDAVTHPDVDGYLLTVRGEGVLRSGQESLTEINVPLVRDESGRVTATVDNIEPGAAYRLTIKAIDEEGGRSVQSPELVVTTPQPDFVLMTTDTNVMVQAGGKPQTVFINLEMSSNLPYDPLLFVDYDRLPDGIYIEFDESVTGRPTATVPVRISAVRGLPLGHYVLPLGAQSGELEKMLNLSIEIVPRQYSINLPLILRQE